MALELNGTTGVSLVQDGVITDANLPAGSVLQVVSTTKTDVFTATSPTFTTVTGLTASITPSSASNKILVLVSVTGNRNAANTQVGQFSVFRGSTNLVNADSTGSRTPSFTSGVQMGDTNGHANMEVYSFTIQDSPSSTSSLTYSVQCRNAGGSEVTYVNRSESDTEGASRGRGVSTITLMEIAG
jgi:hypothetical protein